MNRGTPKVDKPLRKRKRAIRKEMEKRAIGVMPDMRDPPRRGVRGNRGKEGGKGDLVKVFFCKRKRGRNRRNNKPGRWIDEVEGRRR